MASHFPFLSKHRIVEQHRARTLPALLANSICALAARFSNHPLLASHRSSSERLYEASTPFEEQAKLLLLPLLSFPTEETCTALILLSWNELGAGRDSGHFVSARSGWTPRFCACVIADFMVVGSAVDVHGYGAEGRAGSWDAA